jgi:glycosyltransferase involved in cell wall biosynthesis
LSAGGIPLAALRADLDHGWPPGARWITTGGVGGAILEQPVGARLCFRLRADGRRLRLRGGAQLTDSGRGAGKVEVRVAALDPSGAEKVLWERSQRRRPWRRGSSPLYFDTRFEISAGASLVFTATGPDGARVHWSGLEILLEGAAGGDGRTLPPAAAGPATAAMADEEEPREGPLFSILTPVHDPPVEILEATIASVRAQTFEDWELCLLDDGSCDREVREALGRAAAADPRIRHLRRESAGGIATATNAALEMASGEYVALLDHDDLLLPEALGQVEATLCEHPGTDVLYSDEELFEDGVPTHTFAKPHWSPDLLRSQMYTCHLGVYRRSLAMEVGGFRTEFDGSQDFDFVLRVTERTDRVVHIPQVLYRWRVHAGSTAGGGQAKPAAYPAARRAIAQHLERTGVDADVHFGPWQGIYRVVHRLRPGTTVAVAVTGDPSAQSMRGLHAAVCDAGTSGVSDATVFVAGTAESALAQCAKADVIVLCEEAVEPLTRYWLTRLAAFAQQPGVAAVGAKTLAPDGRVERCGLAIEEGLPLPLMLASGAGDPGPLGIGLLPANVAAVGGVVAIAGEPLRRAGGLQPGLGELGVSDYCLRALTTGLRVVSAPDVLVRRSGRPAPANDLEALQAFRSRWGVAFPRDPYFELSIEWPGVERVSPASG